VLPFPICRRSEAFGPQDLPDEAVEELRGFPLPDLLLSLSKHKCMLSPKDFIRVVSRKDDVPGLHEMPCALRESGEQDSELCEDSSYEPKSTGQWSRIDEVVNSLAPELSLEDEPVQKRVIIMISAGPRGVREKSASNRTPSAEALVLAREYQKYQLSFLTSGNNSGYLERIVLANNAH
jgi:hypothetical protein